MKSILCFLLLTYISLGTSFAQTCQTATIVASTPTERFTDHGDGTVTDEATGLMWKVCSEGQSYEADACLGSAATYTWQGALQRAATVNATGFAGYDDWRLPNIKELVSIVERQCVDPAINLNIFPATPSIFVWSSSPSSIYPSGTWFVYFDNGHIGAYSGNRRDGNNVRLVRGGVIVGGGQGDD